MRVYVEKYSQPFPVVSDPERTAYKALAMEYTSVGSMLRLGVVARYLNLMLRGWWPRKPGKDDDIYQFGGDFVLDADGRLRYAHPSALPTDRPSAKELLDAVKAAGV